MKARSAWNMPTAEFVDIGQLQEQLDSGAFIAIENGRVVKYTNMEEKDDDMKVTAALRSRSSSSISISSKKFKKLVKVQATNAGVANTIEKAHGFEEMGEPRPSWPGSSTDGQ